TPAGVPGDCEADVLRGGLEGVGNALPVSLFVVQDVDLRDAQFVLHVRGVDLALEVVRRDDAGVVANAARVVLVRLPRLGADATVGDPDFRVGGAPARA